MKKTISAFLSLILLTATLLSLGACDAAPETDEEALVSDTDDLLEYFLDLKFMTETCVYWHLYSSSLPTPEFLASRKKEDFTRNELFSELLKREDFPKELESLAKKLLKTVTKEKPNPRDLVALKYVLNQDTVEALVKGKENYPNIQSLYADMIKDSNSSGVYYGPLGMID